MLSKWFKGKVLRPKCCGIVAVLGSDTASDLLKIGIQIIQNRGYDSCGIATIPPGGGEICVTKKASQEDSSGKTLKDCIKELMLITEASGIHDGHRVGIAHTRWATHGKKTDLNSHPHLDETLHYGVVHNGTISNYRELKGHLASYGVKFRSQTDSEVIAQLWALHVRTDSAGDIEAAFKKTVSELRGTWGLVCMARECPEKLFIARHGSPLLIGELVDGGVIVGSEQSVMANKVKSYAVIDENETFCVDADGAKRVLGAKVLHEVAIDDVLLTPAPWEYWTDREIDDQPKAVMSALRNLSRVRGGRINLGGLSVHAHRLDTVRRLTLIGCGTSYIAAMFGARVAQVMGSFEAVRVLDAAEFDVDIDVPKEEYAAEEAFIVVSQSGETLDCMRALNLLRDNCPQARLLSVVNVVGSAIARETGWGVYIGAGREVAVASTKAFTCQAVILTLIAAWVAERRMEGNMLSRTEGRVAMIANTVSTLAKLPEMIKGIVEGGKDTIRQRTSAMAVHLSRATSMFVLGRGLCHPIALEGALKIKEISYIHAEGFPAGALKHGPFALLDPVAGTPVVLLIKDDEHKYLLLNVAEQVRSRGATLIVITDISDGSVDYLAHEVFVVPDAGPILTPLLFIIPMQMLAFYLAIERGYNPDKPRGLAKTVTVW